jgi:protein bicaudal C
VKEATLLLMDHMCHNMAHSTPVIMTMEISPQHHAIVIGKVKS